jgi:hypothetical protein
MFHAPAAFWIASDGTRWKNLFLPAQFAAANIHSISVRANPVRSKDFKRTKCFSG